MWRREGRSRGIALVLVIGLVPVLAACDSWFGEAAAPPLPGDRISVLSLERRLEPDPALSDLPVRLPRPFDNPDWPQAGGYPNHVMYHLSLSESPSLAWSVDLGAAGGDDSRILAQPVVAGGTVYAMDVGRQVTAVDAGSGSVAWRADIRPKEESDGGFGGGLAFADGRLYVATGYAELLALDAADGKIVWRAALTGPARTAPTVSGGRVFAVTIDNQLEVLAADDGRKLWNHTAIAESAGIMGGASPAVEGEVVIAGFTSGELFALRVENGRVVWQDSLAAVRRIDAVSDLADIRGRPMIDRGTVYAISHSGRMAAVDLRTGGRLWEQDLGSLESPWSAGDFLYVLTTEAEVVCVSRQDGRIRWVRALPKYRDEEDRKGPIVWTGPVVAGDRVIVVGSNREAYAISPYTGELLGRIQLPAGAYGAPVVAGGTMYMVTDGAELLAFR